MFPSRYKLRFAAPTYVALFCLCHCDDSRPLAAFLTLRELDASQQPVSSELGVLVGVSVVGGDLVRFDVSGGAVEFLDHSALAELCVDIGTEPGGKLTEHHWISLRRHPERDIIRFVVAVHPKAQEAVLNATAFNMSR